MLVTKKQTINTNTNLLACILLNGLNESGKVLHELWLKIFPLNKNNSELYRIMMIFITLTFISFTLILFRGVNIETIEFNFDGMCNHLGLDLFWDIMVGYKFVFAVILLGYLIHWIPERFKVQYRTAFAQLPVPEMVAIVVVAFFCLYQAMSSEMQPFIYFQF